MLASFHRAQKRKRLAGLGMSRAHECNPAAKGRASETMTEAQARRRESSGACDDRVT